MIANVSLTKWGYVLLGFAAATALFDRFFGLSTAWMRFMRSRIALEKLLKVQEIEWLIMNTTPPKAQSATDGIDPRLQNLREFTQQIEAEVISETEKWIVEFESSIAELDNLIKRTSGSETPDQNGSS